MTSAATARRMTALVRQWETSSEGKADFLRRHDVARGTFEYWKRRVRRATAPREPVVFAPVQLVPTLEDRDVTIVVVLATGERLIVPAGVSAAQVRAVVSALRTGC